MIANAAVLAVRPSASVAVTTRLPYVPMLFAVPRTLPDWPSMKRPCGRLPLMAN